MARDIPLDEIGDYYRESLRILVAPTTLEAEKRLKEKTPPLNTEFLSRSWSFQRAVFFTTCYESDSKSNLDPRPSGRRDKHFFENRFLDKSFSIQSVTFSQ